MYKKFAGMIATSTVVMMIFMYLTLQRKVLDMSNIL